ncbi:acyltransferase [Bifidobacterium callimiconis]|uniref:acyltransferase family protein n=1 Tax=Bifidobacterium callimiconis TaxID=2306973 RepID=UPI001BDDA60C|nr:acyltransferase [Bifidobacterium callimiconis]MBT1177295.1 acyltransferase [Bifidobacterium callimiconis]
MGRHTATAGNRHQKRKMRNSSIELLRIIAMLLITSHHYLMYNGFDVLVQPLGVNKVLLETFLYSGGKIGVVVFFAISAWYLSESSDIHSSLKRVWILEREVLFWSLVCLIFTAVTMRGELGASLILRSIFPLFTATWWYATAYCVFVAMFPCLAMAMRAIGRVYHAYLCVVMFILWTVLEGFVPLFSLGLPGGDFLSFVYLYILMTYYRWYMKPIAVSGAVKLLVGGYGLLVIDALAGGFVYEYLGKGERLQIYFSSTEYKLASLMCGFALFILFMNLKFHSRIINVIASSAFSVYLITGYPTLHEKIWSGVLTLDHWYDSPFAFLIVIGIVAGMYVACMICDQARQLLFRLTIDRHRGGIYERLWRKASTSNIAQSFAVEEMERDTHHE